MSLTTSTRLIHTHFAFMGMLGLLMLGIAQVSPAASLYEQLVIDFGLEDRPTPGNFIICHSHGCDGHARVHLSAAQWQQIHQLFDSRNARPADERKIIARAIAKLEQLTGESAGTSTDRGGNMNGFGSPGYQQDCVDESVNTTLYLTLLQDQHLLRWHSVEPRDTRGFVVFGWPHSTAVIRDSTDNKLWAVDSWFHDNGKEPEILPIEDWRSGWRPEGFSGF